EEEEADELYRDVDINQRRGLQVSQDIEDSHVTLTPVQPDGKQESSSVSSFVTSMLNPTTDAEAVSKISGIVHQYMTQQMTEAVREAVQIQTDMLQDSFQRENDEFLRTIDENMKKIIKGQETESDRESEEEETREEEEESFDPIPRTPEDDEDDGNGDEEQDLRISKEERIQEEEEADELYRVESIFTNASSPIAPLPTPTPIITPSTIATITTSSEAPIPPTTIPSVVLENLPTFDSVFRFDDRVKSLDVNFLEFMQTNQFAEAVSKIPGNKSIQRSDEQRNLYKALVDAYEADKTILESYRDTTILERRRGDDDDQEGPSAGSDWGSKRRREGGEHESASTPSEQQPEVQAGLQPGLNLERCQPVSLLLQRNLCRLPVRWTNLHIRKTPTPDLDWNKTLPAIQGGTQTWISELAKQADSRSSFNELLDTLID
nr:hypothetical protein [Tanacetum cinerariifolium]